MSHIADTRLLSRRQLIGAGMAAAALAVAGGTTRASADEAVEFRIGWQKGGNLAVIKARGEFEKALKAKNVTLKWIEFPAGPQMLEGLNVGSIDFGVVGEAPPVFAQAAGAALLYVGYEPPSPAAEQLLIPATSPIKSVAELKGKRVALNKGSNVHYFLVRALEQAGLKYADIEVAFLKPSDARAAFEKGAVDAWAIWDPYGVAAQAQVGAKVLVDGVGLVDNYNFYIGTKDFAAKHPQLLRDVLALINAEDAWIKANLKAAAAIVGPQVGLPDDVAEKSLANYGYGAALLTPEVVAKQQKLADVFTDLKLLPVKLDVASVVWQP